jgi:hypothetical protein
MVRLLANLVALAFFFAFLGCGAGQTFSGLSRAELDERLAKSLRPGTDGAEARRTLELLGFKELVLDQGRRSLTGQIDEDRNGSFDSVLSTFVVWIALDAEQKVESFSASIRLTGP